MFILGVALASEKRLLGSNQDFLDYPFIVAIVAMPNDTSISYSCTGTILSTVVFLSNFLVDG